MRLLFSLIVVLSSGGAAPVLAQAGIGAGLSPDKDALLIRMFTPGAAGAQAGLKVGDRIVEIGQDGGPLVPVTAVPQDLAARLLAGPANSRVTVRYIPAGAAASDAKTVTIVRAVIAQPPAPDPMIAWGEAPGAKASSDDPDLPVWAHPRMAAMRTQGSYLVLLPPGYETGTKRYPVVVLLHGSGDNEQNFGHVVTKLGREGVIYVSLRAPFAAVPTIAQTDQPAFSAHPFDRPESAPERAVARQDYVDWIFDAVADVRKAYRTDDGKVLLYGFSQGGGIAISAALARPQAVSSVWSQAGSPVPDALLSTEALAGLKQNGVRIELSHGEMDTAIPAARSTELSARLSGAGVQNRVRVLAGPHTITDEMGALAKAWLDPFRAR